MRTMDLSRIINKIKHDTVSLSLYNGSVINIISLSLIINTQDY